MRYSQNLSFKLCDFQTANTVQLLRQQKEIRRRKWEEEKLYSCSKQSWNRTHLAAVVQSLRRCTGGALKAGPCGKGLYIVFVNMQTTPPVTTLPILTLSHYLARQMHHFLGKEASLGTLKKIIFNYYTETEDCFIYLFIYLIKEGARYTMCLWSLTESPSALTELKDKNLSGCYYVKTQETNKKNKQTNKANSTSKCFHKEIWELLTVNSEGGERGF